MRTDEYWLEEVSGAVGLGLLAGDVAIATSKLLRGADLASQDRTALQRCVVLLRAIAGPSSGMPPAGRLGHLGSKEPTLDALQAVQGRLSGADIRSYVTPLADAVESALESGAGDTGAQLEAVRDLFASLSEVEVARVTDLSRPRVEALVGGSA